MKSATTGTVSGCVVWIIVVCVLSACLVPVAATIGVVSSLSSSSINFIADNLGPYLCPPESTADILAQQTSGIGTDGRRYNSTSYQMQCVDSNGNVVREPSQDYVIYWSGLLTLIGLILSVLSAFLLAAPAGMIIANLSNRWRKGDNSVNRHAEDIKPSTATSIPATAIVVMDPASIPARKGGLINVHLILDVQPLAGDVYRAITDWTVDHNAASQLKRGQTVAVRIDANDPNIVYPDVPWATFSHLPKNYWSGTTHHRH